MSVRFVGRDKHMITLTLEDLARYPKSMFAIMGATLGPGRKHVVRDMTKPNLELLRIIYTGGTAPDRILIGSDEMYTMVQEDGEEVDLLEWCYLPEDAGNQTVETDWSVEDDLIAPN